MSKLVTVPLSEIEPIRENGLIFAVNALVLHPLGYAIAYSYKDDGGPNDPPIAMILMKTDDGEAFGFEESHQKEAAARLLKFLDSLPAHPSNRNLLETLCGTEKAEALTKWAAKVHNYGVFYGYPSDMAIKAAGPPPV